MTIKTLCKVKLDRWRFAVINPPRKWKGKPPAIPGFQTVKDSFVHQQTKIGTYGRVRSLGRVHTIVKPR